MHRQRGSEGSLGCLHRQVIFTEREIGQTCAQTERAGRVTGLSAHTQVIFTKRETGQTCAQTESVRRVTGLSAQIGNIYREGNRTDVVFPQEKVVYVLHS